MHHRLKRWYWNINFRRVKFRINMKDDRNSRGRRRKQEEKDRARHAHRGSEQTVIFIHNREVDKLGEKCIRRYPKWIIDDVREISRVASQFEEIEVNAGIAWNSCFYRRENQQTTEFNVYQEQHEIFVFDASIRKMKWCTAERNKLINAAINDDTYFLKRPNQICYISSLFSSSFFVHFESDLMKVSAFNYFCFQRTCSNVCVQWNNSIQFSYVYEENPLLFRRFHKFKIHPVVVKLLKDNTKFTFEITNYVENKHRHTYLFEKTIFFLVISENSTLFRWF